MNMEEKKISTKRVYDGKVVHLDVDDVICPNGEKSVREVVRHSGGAAILYINEKDEVLLIKQFRYPYNEVIYEIPAGKIENKENPYNTALRELEEETGFKTNELTHLGNIYPTVGYTDEIIYIYLAKDVIKTHTNFDRDEFIVYEYIPLSKVKEMIINNEIKDAKTVCAISYYLLKNKN